MILMSRFTKPTTVLTMPPHTPAVLSRTQSHAAPTALLMRRKPPTMASFHLSLYQVRAFHTALATVAILSFTHDHAAAVAALIFDQFLITKPSIRPSGPVTAARMRRQCLRKKSTSHERPAPICLSLSHAHFATAARARKTAPATLPTTLKAAWTKARNQPTFL